MIAQFRARRASSRAAATPMPGDDDVEQREMP
jgi:hypothetical protein